MALAFLILIVAYTAITAYIDAQHFKEGQFFKDHKPRFFHRAYCMMLVAIFNLQFAIAGTLIFFALFDHILNRFRGMKFTYIGGTAETDKYFKERPSLYYSLQLITLCAGLSLLLI